MKNYYERRITYDPKTENYKVSVPELGIEVLSDTEVGGLVDVRKEVEEAAAKPRVVPTSFKELSLDDMFGIDLKDQDQVLKLPPGFRIRMHDDSFTLEYDPSIREWTLSGK